MEPGTLCPSHYLTWSQSDWHYYFIFQPLAGGVSLVKQYLKVRTGRLKADEENVDEDFELKKERKTMAEIRFEAILLAYETNNHNAQAACKELKISKATFYRAMHKNNWAIVRRAKKKVG
jgi:transcriptional regulator with AAA-type ATPase domain